MKNYGDKGRTGGRTERVLNKSSEIAREKAR